MKKRKLMAPWTNLSAYISSILHSNEIRLKATLQKKNNLFSYSQTSNEIQNITQAHNSPYRDIRCKFFGTALNRALINFIYLVPTKTHCTKNSENLCQYYQPIRSWSLATDLLMDLHVRFHFH